MSTLAIVIPLVMLVLTVLGLVAKITSFTTKIELYVKEMRRERKAIVRIPILEMRIGYIEQHLKIKSPQASGAIPDHGEDEDHEN